MSAAGPIRVVTEADGPEVWLLDALQAGLDESGLRARARSEPAIAGARHVSRSYRYPYALLAGHDEPVGVDIERITPFDAVFRDSISTPAERDETLGELSPDAHLTSLWCSKEALSKALGDALQYDPRRLDSPMRWPQGRAGRWQAAALAAPAGHAAWLCWRRGPES